MNTEPPTPAPDLDAHLIRPIWPAPPSVRAVVTTRQIPGDSASASATQRSVGGYADFNLALHVGDDAGVVKRHRAHLARITDMPASAFCWLEQVHGTRVVQRSSASAAHRTAAPDAIEQADGVFTNTAGVVCTVMTADCLPVLLCDEAGRSVAAVHAGWRGLADGVIESALQHFAAPERVLAWLGPAIGPQHFEVGPEVYDRFCAQNASAASAFAPQADGRYLADLYALARMRLRAAGVGAVFGGDYCTFAEAQHFFSYRRQGPESGRMASMIWLAD